MASRPMNTFKKRVNGRSIGAQYFDRLIMIGFALRQRVIVVCDGVGFGGGRLLDRIPKLSIQTFLLE
jgi:hypothetical protein